MSDFIELGIEGIDKVVDKHFDKVPDAALQSRTYHPRTIRNKYHKHRHGSSSSSSESEDESAARMSQDLRHNRGGAGPAPPYPIEYSYVPYSSDPPHQRSEYMPSPPPAEQAYYAPPPSRFGRRNEDRDEDGYNSDRRPQRPRLVTRRSSSCHIPREREEYGYNDRQMVQRRRRGSSRDSSDIGSRTKDVGRRHGRREVEEYFTTSPVGITGAMAGAVVGGWAARKAQVASGREGKHHGGSSLLTLLGAAAGGLAANAAIDKFEDKKKETMGKEDAWEEKWGGRDEDRDDRRGRQDNGRVHRRRHRSRSHSNDR